VLVPIGFVSDHLEVRYDLDVAVAETAAGLGLPVARAATPGTDPRFVSMITSFVAQRQLAAASPLGHRAAFCQAGCCQPGSAAARA
jgi:ferrochelatase